jgi:hypothetical protein
MRIRPFIASVLAGLLLIFGVGVAATTAEARTGSTVTFNHMDGSIPKTIDFRVVKVSGAFFYLSWTETLSNVKYVCPKSGDYYINFENPFGSVKSLADGECLWPAYRGQYNIGYYKRG